MVLQEVQVELKKTQSIVQYQQYNMNIIIIMFELWKKKSGPMKHPAESPVNQLNNVDFKLSLL